MKTEAGVASAGAAGWFCLRAQPKHEHIAAGHLRETGAAEVFLPRIRFQRATRRGPAWATEALFPGYLFARFDWQASLRQVQAARGVRGVVHFGRHWPTIPEEIITGLRQVVGDSELRAVETTFAPGDEVQIIGGTMSGLNAVIARVMPGRERVGVLMEFLGRQTMVEIATTAITKPESARSTLIKAGSIPPE